MLTYDLGKDKELERISSRRPKGLAFKAKPFGPYLEGKNALLRKSTREGENYGGLTHRRAVSPHRKKWQGTLIMPNADFDSESHYEQGHGGRYVSEVTSWSRKAYLGYLKKKNIRPHPLEEMPRDRKRRLPEEERPRAPKTFVERSGRN